MRILALVLSGLFLTAAAATARMIVGTARPGDPCDNAWQCSTKFCRMGGGIGTCRCQPPGHCLTYG